MTSHVISISAHVNYAKHSLSTYLSLCSPKMYFKYLAGESVEYLCKDPRATRESIKYYVTTKFRSAESGISSNFIW